MLYVWSVSSEGRQPPMDSVIKLYPPLNFHAARHSSALLLAGAEHPCAKRRSTDAMFTTARFSSRALIRFCALLGPFVGPWTHII